VRDEDVLGGVGLRGERNGGLEEANRMGNRGIGRWAHQEVVGTGEAACARGNQHDQSVSTRQDARSKQSLGHTGAFDPLMQTMKRAMRVGEGGGGARE
jgi:hypothetical protein